MAKCPNWLTGILVAIVAPAGFRAVLADEGYYQSPVRSLQIIEGALPADVSPDDTWRNADMLIAMRPYAVVDGAGEAYVDFVNERDSRWQPAPVALSEARLAIAAAQGKDVTGRLFVPDSDLHGMTAVKFRIPATAITSAAHDAFYRAQQAHYAALLDRNIPGTAWFRHQIAQARKDQNAKGPDLAQNAPDIIVDDGLFPQRRTWRDNDDLSATYALFTGGRAMSENLQLDRVLLRTASADEMTVDIDPIAGISVQPIDWSALVKDLHPELDPLAALIPADQHAVFFPSFNALTAIADEAEVQGVPILRLVDVRSEDARTRERYERQLGLSLNALTRVLGPQLVTSVAITGSDPYFRTGTDVAVLFESSHSDSLRSALAAMQKDSKGKEIQGEIGGVKYSGVKSDDRSVCSFMAALGNAVVVTNSLSQLEQLANVKGGKTPAINSLPEYIFFRDRYKRGDTEESALVILSDATIRRWCGPRWRIATSRRMRDAAVMAELQATFMDDLARGNAEAGPIHTDLPLAGAGPLRLTPQGVWSAAYNTPAFLTPLVEIPITKVTKAEARAYEQWRDTYQRNWRQYFDPIALRLSVNQTHVSADVTVMPLIASSEYQQVIEVSRGAALKPFAGDLHDAIIHAAFAINMQSQSSQQWAGFASLIAPKIGSPLGWLGQCVSLFADDDPFWKELANVPDDDRDRFMEQNVFRLPIALYAESTNSLKLTGFLTAVHAYIDQTAPGMTVWEPRTHNEIGYVRIGPSAQAKAEPGMENAAVYYAATAGGLLVSPNEPLLKRALDRQAARQQAQAASQPMPAIDAGPWLGTNMGLKAGGGAIEIMNALARQSLQNTLQLRAWGNIPILNEWKHRYPDSNPIQVHEKFWQTRLVCPGGGSYVWNESDQTMESTLYGSPANPKEGPANLPALQAFSFSEFGVTFEDKGLRARTDLRRKK